MNLRILLFFFFGSEAQIDRKYKVDKLVGDLWECQNKKTVENVVVTWEAFLHVE